MEVNQFGKIKTKIKTMKTYIIAEIGINHNGDMKIAKELIDTAKTEGCDAVKFQKRTIEEVYTAKELDAPRESPWGTTNRQQKEGLEFSMEEYKELEAYSKALGLDFIVSCWGLNSLKEVEVNLNVSHHKIASAMLTDRAFLEALNATGKPIIVSTGMSSQEEVSKAMAILENVDSILACTSTYPTKAEEINLSYIDVLKAEYPKLKVGFSNHYSGLVACFGAVARGAEIIEFHITKDRTMYGSDQAASIENVHQLVKGIRALEEMVGDGVKVVYEDEKPIASKLRKNNTI
jgi:N-acetylneuraminate synthase